MPAMISDSSSSDSDDDAWPVGCQPTNDPSTARFPSPSRQPRHLSNTPAPPRAGSQSDSGSDSALHPTIDVLPNRTCRRGVRTSLPEPRHSSPCSRIIWRDWVGSVPQPHSDTPSTVPTIELAHNHVKDVHTSISCDGSYLLYEGVIAKDQTPLS